MAENTTNVGVTEDINLQLRTNFEQVLKAAVARYSSFQSQIGGMSRQLSNSLTNMHNQLSVSSRSMVDSNVAAVKKQFDSTRDSFRQVSAEINKITDLQKRSADIVASGQKKIDQVMSRKGISTQLQQKAVKSIQTTTIKSLTDLDNKIQQGMGRIAAKANKNIAQATAGSMQIAFRNAHDSMNKLKPLAKEIKTLLSSGMGTGSQFNILKGAETQLQKIRQSVRQQQTRMVAAERNVQTARQALLQQTSEVMIKGNKRYLESAEKTYSAVREDARRTVQRQITFERELEQVRKQVNSAAIQGIRNLQKSMASTSPDAIIRQMNAVQNRALSEGKSKLKSTRTTMEDLSSQANRLYQKYNNNLEKIRGAILNLRNLNKQGLIPGSVVQRNINQLQKLEDRYKRLQYQVKNSVKTVAREMDRQRQRSSKTVLGFGMDMLRNVRWQVAGVIYLVSKAINGIRRVFFDTMSEIMEYRKSAYALAASMAGQFYTPLEKSFGHLYTYSRGLMEHLEMQAARTYLTLEDMVMLTKTFAQGGMVPKTEDISKIAAIGTAIKVLTEGMTNAGQQMRQELYAVIQGRQRATDQLAKFLSLQGINVKKLVKEAREEGTSLIDALYGKLHQFAELNKHLTDEYATQVNALEVTWKILKRIGAEGVMLTLAKNIQSFNDALMNPNTLRLTERGQQVAITINAVMESIRFIVDEVGTILAHLFDVVADVVNGFSTILITLVKIATGVETTTKGLEDWQVVLGGIYYTVAAIATGIEGIITLFKSAIKAASGLVKILSSVAIASYKLLDNQLKILDKALSFDFEGAKNVIKSSIQDALNLTKSGVQDFKDIGKEWNELLGRTRNKFVNINETIIKLGNDLKKVRGAGTEGILSGLFKGVKLPIAAIDEVTKKLQKLKAESQIGRNKYIEMLRQNEAVYNNLSKKANDSLSQLRAMRQAALESKDMGSVKKIDIAIGQTIHSVRKLDEWWTLLQKKLNNKIKVIDDREAAKLVRFEKQFKRMLLSLREEPVTRLDKVNQDIEKLRQNVLSLAKTNPMVAKNINLLMQALDAKKIKDTAEAVRETKNEFTALMEQISGKDKLTVFEKINNEFNKLKETIKKNVNLSKEQVKTLFASINVARERRKEEEKIKFVHEQQIRLFDLMRQKADVLGAMSNRPADEQAAESIRLMADYRQKIAEVQEQYRQLVLKYGQGSSQVRQFGAVAKETIENLGTLYQEHLKNVQEPFWAEMEDMSRGWADNTADALADIVMDFENAAETLDSLFNSIIKDSLSSFFRNFVTDKMFNLFGGGGEKGSIFGSIGGLFGGGGSEEKGGGAVGDVVSKVKDVGGMEPGQQLMVTQIITAITTATTTLTTAFTTALTTLGTTVVTGLTTLGTSIVSAITASTTAIVSALTSTMATSMAGGFSFIPMADGGMITEPIIGQGVNSGTGYILGEAGPELVTPMNSLSNLVTPVNNNTSLTIQLQAIDTQSGIEFLMRHKDLLEGTFARSIASNRVGRRAVRGAR